MKKQFIALLLIGLILLQPFTAYALTLGEAKQAWYDAKKSSREAQEIHREAKITWATDKTEENNQKVIESGKDALHAALDEVEAWLIWRQIEVQENPEIPDDLEALILGDITANLEKIDELHVDVDGVENRLELGLVFLKMVGKYLELLADVARNTGYVWVHIANNYADTIMDYEAQLREAAQSIDNNEAIIEKLDLALSELESARSSIDNAEHEYQQVIIPGTPVLKFANGNQYLRTAKNHLISAQGRLKQAFRLISEAN
jgi:exonuclease VII small subunit